MALLERIVIMSYVIINHELCDYHCLKCRFIDRYSPLTYIHPHTIRHPTPPTYSQTQVEMKGNISEICEFL